jgi:hypothetical protein
VQGDAEKPGDPPFWLIPAASGADKEPPATAPPGPAPTRLTLTLATPEYLVLNLRQYPTWRIRLNGHDAAPVAPRRYDGLITLVLPAGQDTIVLAQTHTPDQDLGLGLSALACLATFGLYRKELSAHSSQA